MSAPGTIDLRCRCGRVFHADPSHAGKTIRCRCGRLIRVRAARQRGDLAVRRIGPVLGRYWRKPGVLAGTFPRASRSVAALCWVYLAWVIGATLLLWTLGDRWSIATALLFGPRWVLLLPVPVLVLAALLTRPGLLLLILTGLGLTLGPAMGYRIGWRSWFRAGPGELRVITYNIDSGENALFGSDSQGARTARSRCNGVPRMQRSHRRAAVLAGRLERAE